MNTNEKPLPKRRRTRLSCFDYASPGTYFVTICTQDRQCALGWIDDELDGLASEPDDRVGQGLCPCRLSSVGLVVEDEIRSLQGRYSGIDVEKYVVMPNHVHMLVSMRQGQSPCPTLSSVVGAFKSLSTKRANRLVQTPGSKLWQTSFHDHVVRDQSDYDRLWRYIDDNPRKWRDDIYHREG